MYKGRGSAGAGSKKDNIQVIKPVPKFLQGLKYQQPEEEAKLESKFAHDESEKDEENYDIENAQVLDENDDLIDKKENKGKGPQDEVDKSIQKKVEGQRVDIHNFHPTFQTKKLISKGKPHQENDKKSSLEKHRGKNKAGTIIQDKAKRDEKEAVKNKDQNKSQENNKRSLDKLVANYLKEEKDKDEPKKQKKIKSSLLSFGDEE